MIPIYNLQRIKAPFYCDRSLFFLQWQYQDFLMLLAFFFSCASLQQWSWPFWNLTKKGRVKNIEPTALLSIGPFCNRKACKVTQGLYLESQTFCILILFFQVCNSSESQLTKRKTIMVMTLRRNEEEKYYRVNATFECNSCPNY